MGGDNGLPAETLYSLRRYVWAKELGFRMYVVSNRFRISEGINSVQNFRLCTGTSETEVNDVQSKMIS